MREYCLVGSFPDVSPSLVCLHSGNSIWTKHDDIIIISPHFRETHLDLNCEAHPLQPSSIDLLRICEHATCINQHTNWPSVWTPCSRRIGKKTPNSLPFLLLRWFYLFFEASRLRAGVSAFALCGPFVWPVLWSRTLELNPLLDQFTCQYSDVLLW